MTFPEALIELRELRWELEDAWRCDTASLARLWAGKRITADANTDALLGRQNGRRLQALRIAEQVLTELDRGPRLDDVEG